MDERIAKLQELMKKEGTAAELLSQKTPEEAQAYLENHGIEFSLDEVKAIGAQIEKIINKEIPAEKLEALMNGELSEDVLEDVAGGVVLLSTAGCIILGLGISAAAAGTGVGIGAAIAHWDTVSSAVSDAASAVGDWFRSW